MSADAFVALCSALRALGAVKIEADPHGGYSAVFTPSPIRPATVEDVRPVRGGNVPSDDELQEEAFAKELGL